MEFVSLIAAIFSIAAAVFTFIQSKKVKEVKDSLSKQYSNINQQSFIPVLKEIQSELNQLAITSSTKGGKLEVSKTKISNNFNQVLSDLKLTNSEGDVRKIVSDAQEEMRGVINLETNTIDDESLYKVTILLQDALSKINANIVKI